MSQDRRVVWNEGMLLTPHHFQQLDNYHEGQLESRISSLVAHRWGVLDVRVNRDAIANGSFELLSCSGVMPDGLVVNIPQASPAPPARPVADHFATSADRLEVHLAVPSRRVGAANFQSNGSVGASSGNAGGNGGGSSASVESSIRFLQEPATVIDETTGENEQQIAVARANFRLVFGDELREGYSSIKVGELERTTTGQLALKETYVPPALHLGASPWLTNLLRQLIEFLIAKSRTLGERRHQSSSGRALFTTDDGMVLWVLPTINSAIPVLAHLFRMPVVHPERLYAELARLAGSLMTLVFDRHPKDLVRYDHSDLYTTFRQLDMEIRDLLDRVDPKRYVPIPLVQERPSLHVARVNDDALLREAEFFLAVGANIPENRVIERVPFAIKIADRDGIDAAINNALQGVSLTHVTPPGQIPTRAGLHYFRLDRNDRDLALTRFWDRIIALKTISVWVADEFPEARLEMYAIKPN